MKGKGSIRDLNSYDARSKLEKEKLAKGYASGAIDKSIPAAGMNRAMRRIAAQRNRRSP
jgi:hypothetical protein